MDRNIVHMELPQRVHRELKVRAARKGVKIGVIVEELVYPKKHAKNLS